MNNVRVRFAPSPTGFLHIGGLRTMLYNYMFAKKNNGKIILRIEDTDQKRIVVGAVDNLINTFKVFELEFDEGPLIGGQYGPYCQSERLSIYRKYADELVKNGNAYRCFCKEEILEKIKLDNKMNKVAKYDSRCFKLNSREVDKRIQSNENYVIRLKIPDNRIFIIHDEIRGDIKIDSSQLDDQIIIKTDGFPTYHLASVVDDHLMDISHIIRGEEWLSSTPKHLFLYECFGWSHPKWIHLPLILNKDRSKLSKRLNDISVNNYIDSGYLKEAIINYIALLGWHNADDKEIYTLEELCKKFSLDRINTSGSIFDITKLNWMNSYYLKNLPLAMISERCRKYFIENYIDISEIDKYNKVVDLIRKRVTVLTEILPNSLYFYKDNIYQNSQIEILKSAKSKVVLQWILNQLYDKNVTDINLTKEMINEGKKILNMNSNEYYLPINIALSYNNSCPELHNIISIIGKEKTLSRLSNALAL